MSAHLNQGILSATFIPLVPMRRYPSRGSIRPKISTMPRQQTEPDALLDVYKLTVEKKRLEQELQNLEMRRQQIGDRLTLLNQQITSVEATIQQMRSSEDSPAAASTTPASKVASTNSSETFDTLFLEY